MTALILPFPEISPEVFSVSLFGMDFALRWYALAYIVGIGLGWLAARMALARPRLWRNDTPPMTQGQLEDLLTWIILGIVIGGRLGFVLFYQPGYYLAHPLEIPMIWQGGMAFHGGLLGVVAAVWIYCARNALPLLPTAAWARCIIGVATSITHSWPAVRSSTSWPASRLNWPR